MKKTGGGHNRVRLLSFQGGTTHLHCMDSFDPLTFSCPDFTTVELLPKPSTVQAILAFSKSTAHVRTRVGDGWVNQN